MDLSIEPLREEKMDDYIKTYWAAFEPESANMIMPMIWPQGLREDLMERFRYRIREKTGGDLATYCFTAKDTNTGEIVGVSWWGVDQDPPKTKEDIDNAWRATTEKRAQEPPVADMHHELFEAFAKVSFYSEVETAAGQPYMTLSLLAVHPKYHRRGAGSRLLKHGLEKADRLGLPVYLDCGVMGKPLYELFGFKETGDMPLNCLDYGGRSDGRHWLMLRPAKDKS